MARAFTLQPWQEVTAIAGYHIDVIATVASVEMKPFFLVPDAKSLFANNCIRKMNHHHGSCPEIIVTLQIAESPEFFNFDGMAASFL